MEGIEEIDLQWKAASLVKELGKQALHTACNASPSFADMLASSCAATLLSCADPAHMICWSDGKVDMTDTIHYDHVPWHATVGTVFTSGRAACARQGALHVTLLVGLHGI
jgi:hypothetical protein